MLSEFATHLPVSFGFLQELVHGPGTGEALARAVLRWTHFVAGIAWIGLLYFFNLVNVPVQKLMDADTKKKINPDLLGRSLWYFRWGAVVTVLAGLTYYAMYILSGEARNAGLNPWTYLGIWLVIVLITYAGLYGVYQVPALTKDGRVLAVDCYSDDPVYSRNRLRARQRRRHGRKIPRQQVCFHRHRRRLRHHDALERVGRHLARAETRHRRFQRRRHSAFTRRCAQSISGLTHERMAFIAHALFDGHVARRLDSVRKIDAEGGAL